eukprot:5613880-Pyramimonas_sp.AAC.1
MCENKAFHSGNGPIFPSRNPLGTHLGGAREGLVGTSSAVETASEPVLGPPGAHVELGGASDRSWSALGAVFGALLGRLGRPPT